MNQRVDRVPALAMASLCLALAACGRGEAPASEAEGLKSAGIASGQGMAASGASGKALAAADDRGPQGGSDPMIAATWNPAEAQAMAASGSAPTANGVQRVAVIDPNGFEKPMPALWVQIPAGWKSSGGVVWNQQAPCGATPSYQWQAQSPDGSQRLQILPAEAWTYDNLGMDIQGGRCPRWPITDVRTYLQSFAQRQRPGARVLDYRARNDLIRTPAVPSDAQNRNWKEGGELLIAYSGPGGEMRESILAVAQFQQTTMPGVMPGEVRTFISGIVGGPVIASAPAGQLDLAMVTRFAMSSEPDPQWQARMNRHNTAIARQGVQGQAARGAIIAETQREIADINQRGYESRDASGDAMHRANIDGINNVDRYTDPVSGAEVQLDNRYDNAWRTNDGGYIQSNDPNLNPQVDLGIEAEQMERNE